VSRGGAILASLLVTIGRPTWWLLALAAFLVRGGVVVFVLPIVLLPSPLAISNMVSPIVVPIALGRIGPDAMAVAVGAFVLVVVWLIGGGWFASTTELTLIREAAAAAAEEGVGHARHGRAGDNDPGEGGSPPASSPSVPRDSVLVGRLLTARLVAWSPFAAATGIGIARIVAITYSELTRPFEVVTPLAIRVVLGAAPELAVIAIAWLLGELVGGLAGRRIVLDGAVPGQALLGAAMDVVRRPVSILLPWLLTTGLLLTILGGTVGAAGIAWSRVTVALSGRVVDPPTVALSLLLFVAIWLAAIVLAGLLAAVRGVVQTFEDVRQRSATRTFGASAQQRPGDWSVPGEGGSL
jgi:hypothetical protein